MNYFRKTKFRETSLIFVGIFIAIIYFTISDSSEEQGKAVQEIMDARVEEEKIVTTSTSSTSTTTAVSLSQTESYAQNNTLDQLVSNEMWYLYDADPPKSKYPEDLRKIEVLQTKLSDIYPEVQITSIYDEQTYQYHEKYCAEYNITECSLPYISDEHSYVTTTTTTTTLYQNGIVIGYVRDVQLNDKGEVNGILINYRYWVSVDSSVELYEFNTKIDEWDFKQGDLVVAVLAGEKFDSLPAQSVASAIHIIYEPEPIPLPDN